MGYKIVDITNDGKMIKKLHRFFYDLDKDFVPKLKRYFFLIRLGNAFVIMNGSKIVGGLVMYSIPEQNVVLNYYVPESARNSSISLRTLEILLGFNDKHKGKKMYIKSKDVSAYKRFVTHYKDDIYRLELPDRRWR